MSNQIELPRVFIASSVPGLELADAIHAGLQYDARCTVWRQGVFNLSKGTLEELEQALDKFDFAVFVMRPDDVSTMRGETHTVVRDNVIFELGLFIGRLGRERCFMVIPRSAAAVTLPTDLLGIKPATYEDERSDEPFAAVGTACSAIRTAMKKEGPLQKRNSDEQSHAPQMDDNDILSSVQAWLMKPRDPKEKQLHINFAETEKALNLPAGSTAKHIANAVRHSKYRTIRTGATTVFLEEKGPAPPRGIPGPGFAARDGFGLSDIG